MSNPLYIRVRGRVLGPYDPEKLQSLAQQGQFSRMHEVSEDGVTWVKAMNYPELFTANLATPTLNKPVATKTATATSTAASETRTSTTTNNNHQQGGNWYYTSHGHEVGPVSMAEMQAAARAGNITAADQVWTDGMPQWVPANQVLPIPPSPSESVPTAIPAAPTVPIERGIADDVPEDVIRSLAGSRPWVLLVGIVLLIKGVLGLVVSIILLAAPGRFETRAFNAISGITGLITAIVLGVAGWLLILYASRISACAYQKTSTSLRQALDASRAFWMYVGILSIIYLTYVTILVLYVFALASSLT